ncbi:H:Cl exchange transporter 7 [Echinococcus multilocularis]|uniref:Chloride channel protein n=1 Tax=Echinococcus multilocularis TaxID=6211 RepID=A0A068Y8F9_ECHMU|nr:H:Cl exchange transporter 7 [Echinococcus multilocularis]
MPSQLITNIISFPQISRLTRSNGIRFRRLSTGAGASVTGNSDGSRSTSESTARLSFYADTVIGEEVLDQKYEGLEYDTPEVPALKKEMATLAHQGNWRIILLRFTLLFAIGCTTGATATVIDFLTTTICSIKFVIIQYLFGEHYASWTLLIPAFVWVLINCLFILVAVVMTVFVAPVAAGSGIPQIKCYLNGLNVPFILRARTMMAKAVGVILTVCGGLLVGKEGPMIHIGSVVAAGFSQGRITCFGLSLRSFRCFRNDAEKRDFVSAGAAAGVAAAFGAPVGGLLFTLEEGASFIFQRLTWNTLFASMISMFTLALFRSIIDGQPFKFTPGGLVSFGMFENVTSYNAYELMAFVLMGIIGGLIGALFVAFNRVLTKYRQSYLKTRSAKIIDAVLIGFFTTVLSFAILVLRSDCRSLFQKDTNEFRQVVCPNGEYNRVGALLFTTPARALNALFHDPPRSFNDDTLFIFAPYTFFIACITYGLSVPCGLFIPSLLLGAAWGRVTGELLYGFSPQNFPDPSKFALIGAAAQLGGIVRMIASLTVVLVEATGNVILGLPVLITLIPAKYIGDYFTEGIYDMHINLSGMALVPWEANTRCVQLRALDVMTSPVVVLDTVMPVRELYQLVFDNPHHAFPVVEGHRDPDHFNYGRLVGMISAQHIALMIKKKVYNPLDGQDTPRLTANDFDDAYPRFYKLKNVLLNVSDDEFERSLDFRPYMNHAPYSVSVDMSMTRVFALFRRLGLRHLPVVDNFNQVRGMITRKDLCRFRFAPAGKVAERLFSRIY